MPIVVGVQFKPVTKVYHFDSNQLLDLVHQDYVVVDTARGPEVAQVVQPPHQIGDAEVVGEMKSVLRRANPWDMVQRDLWQHKEQEALAHLPRQGTRTPPRHQDGALRVQLRRRTAARLLCV